MAYFKLNNELMCGIKISTLLELDKETIIDKARIVLQERSAKKE